MKKLSPYLVALFALLLSVGANAQSKPGADYFKGKWNIVIKGTPDGDAKLIFVLDSRNDSITGVVQDTTGNEVAKITNVELKDEEVSLYFNIQNYDVILLLKKKDDDNVTGNLLNMFEAEGKRIKLTK